MDADDAGAPPSAANSQFEREKWLKEHEFEREKWLKSREDSDRDFKAKDRELKVKEGELEVRRVEAKRTFLSNPLALALIGATIAAIANVWVAYHNGNEQRAVENIRADLGRELERQKAQDDRIVSAVNGDPTIASARLRFLAETHLIMDDALRTFILQYIQTQAITVPPTVPAAAPPPPPGVPVRKVAVESGWLDGGHSQPEVCGRLMEAVKAQNPGKSVRISNMSEDNKKDFIGHVTYNYRCEFEIQ